MKPSEAVPYLPISIVGCYAIYFGKVAEERPRNAIPTLPSDIQPRYAATEEGKRHYRKDGRGTRLIMTTSHKSGRPGPCYPQPRNTSTCFHAWTILGVTVRRREQPSVEQSSVLVRDEKEPWKCIKHKGDFIDKRKSTAMFPSR